jgi:type II secretory pathway component PulF
MAGHPDAFGPEVIALVRAGEEAGRLPVIFKQLANSQQKTLRIFRKLKNGMIYPAIVLLMSIGVIIVMSYTLVPAVSKLYGSFEAELPAATKLMMVISDTLINYPWTVLIPFVLVFMLFKNMKKITANPSVQRFMLKVPGLGSIVRKAAAAVSFRALSMLMESNVRLGTSLQITADAAPHVYYKEFFTNVREHIDAGLGLSESFLLESHLLGPDGRSICGIMDIAAETGGANDMLDEIANDYEEELDGYASQIDKVLEPITIIVLGTMVGFLIYAIYGPIFGMGDVVLPDK